MGATLQHRSLTTPFPSWAAGKPVPSLDPLLLLTSAQLDLRRASAGGTCPAITGCCCLTLAAVSRPAPLESCVGTGMDFLQALAPLPLQNPCPCCSPTASPGKDPSPGGAPRPTGGRCVAGVPVGLFGVTSAYG